MISAVQTSYSHNIQKHQDNSNIGYGIGCAIRKVASWFFTKAETTFLPYWQGIFSEKTVRVVHVTDAVQDDFASLSLDIAASLNPESLPLGKTLDIEAIIPTAGFVIKDQAILNALRITTVANRLQIPLYPGAPDLEHQVIPPNYYGKDGLEDLGGWPNVNATGVVQGASGSEKIIELVLSASPKKPITIVVTAPLTEVAKALVKLEEQDPTGSFAQNINAILLRGGCIYPDDANSYGCNAPYNVPDSKKNSEINFYSDVSAIQNVTRICNQHKIPRILLPLGLTQSTLWTKEQIATLKGINNVVAEKLANVTKVVPFPDARHFPADTYPLHDFFAAAALIRPDLFNAMKVALTSVGSVGEITINPNATDEERLVYLLSLPEATQDTFFDAVLPQLNAYACYFNPNLETCDPDYQLKRILEIAIPAGVGGLGLVLFFTIWIIRSKRAEKRLLTEKSRLLEEKNRLKDQNATLSVTVDGMQHLIVGMQKEMGVPSAQEGEEDIE